MKSEGTIDTTMRAMRFPNPVRAPRPLHIRGAMRLPWVLLVEASPERPRILGANRMVMCAEFDSTLIGPLTVQGVTSPGRGPRTALAVVVPVRTDRRVVDVPLVPIGRRTRSLTWRDSDVASLAVRLTKVLGR